MRAARGRLAVAALAVGVLALAAACAPVTAASPALDGLGAPASPLASREVAARTSCPDGEAAGELCAVALPTGTPQPSPTAGPAPAGREATATDLPKRATPSPAPGATPSAPATPPACLETVCYYPGQLRLKRPIAPGGRDTIDFSYRFGTTQGGSRDPHHGVEFLNSSGTPVLAALEGVVVLAGDDRQVFQGPYSYFYGNLVILEHRLPDLEGPLYTLYAHLSEIAVQAGQRVQTGEALGKVGMTGVATGSHLHFEVRLGENSYAAARNPELWLAPRADEHGTPHGALAGRILDGDGRYLAVPNIVIQHLPGPNQPANYELYLETYQEKALVGQPPWAENFAAGDLPAGWYRIVYVQNGMQEQLVEVLPGQLTVVNLTIGR